MRVLALLLTASVAAAGDIELRRAEVRVQLAETRLRFAQEALSDAEKLFKANMVSAEEMEAVLLARHEAEAELEWRALDFLEVRASKKAPNDDIAAPAVDGRDYVLRRMKVRLELATRLMDAARKRLARIQRLAKAGAATPYEEAQARTETGCLAAEREALRAALDIRKAVVAGTIDRAKGGREVDRARAEAAVKCGELRYMLARDRKRELEAAHEAGRTTAAELRAASTEAAAREADLLLAQLDLKQAETALQKK